MDFAQWFRRKHRDGRTDRRTDGRTEAIAISPSLFFKKKRGDNNNNNNNNNNNKNNNSFKYQLKTIVITVASKTLLITMHNHPNQIERIFLYTVIYYIMKVK